MALAPRDIPITRAQVGPWLTEYKAIQSPPPLRTFLLTKLTAAGIDGNLKVDTGGNDSLANETALVDLIIADVPSYG